MYSQSLQRPCGESWCLFISNQVLTSGAALHGRLVYVAHYSQQARYGGRVRANRRGTRAVSGLGSPPLDRSLQQDQSLCIADISAAADIFLARILVSRPPSYLTYL